MLYCIRNLSTYAVEVFKNLHRVGGEVEWQRGYIALDTRQESVT